MTFEMALAERIKRGESMTTAIQGAMRDSGVERITLKDIKRAVDANPRAFPLAYKRLR